MPEPKVTNQELLLQIVRDIEILKANSIQILQASQDHETRIRDLEKQSNRTAWIPALITAVVTSVAVFLISKGLK
jgi:type IV secretory pathway component VirB8